MRLISDEDERLLAKSGYKQDLFRGLTSSMNFAFGYTEVGVLICLTSSIFNFGLEHGGPATMVFGWAFCFTMTLCVVLNMAEICSAYPTAGSVYNWAGNLAPKETSLLWAYWTGIFNGFGNIAGDASFAWVFATMLSSALESSGFAPLSTVLLVTVSIFALFGWSLLNSFRVDRVGWIMILAAVLQLGVTVGLVVVLLFLAPSFNSAEYVLTHFENKTGFSSPFYVASISILFSLFGFSGYEASAHLAEETSGSSVAAPLGLIKTCVATGSCGMLIILGLLFAMQDIGLAISSENAAIEIVKQASSAGVSSATAWCLVVIVFFCGLSSVAVTARIVYALGRDQICPHSEVLSEVNPYTKSPVNVLIAIFLVDTILMLLALVSTTAFENIVGMSVFGFQFSYGTPILLKLLLPPDSASASTIRGCQMYLGEWKGSALAWVAVVWLFGSCAVLCLPTEAPVTAQNMNYCGVVVCGLVALGQLNWELSSKYRFKGPKRVDDDCTPLLRVATTTSSSSDETTYQGAPLNGFLDYKPPTLKK